MIHLWDCASLYSQLAVVGWASLLLVAIPVTVQSLGNAWIVLQVSRDSRTHHYFSPECGFLPQSATSFLKVPSGDNYFLSFSIA